MFVPPFIIQLLFFIHMYIIINVCVYNNHQNSVFWWLSNIFHCFVDYLFYMILKEFLIW